MKYKHLIEVIIKRIENNEYQYGKKMPTIRELAVEFGVSSMTVKKALDYLTRYGYIEKRQGSGTYVKMNSDKISPHIPLSGNSARFPKKNLKTKIIKFDVVHPNTEAADQLQISKDEFVYKIERIRLLDDKPIIMEHVYMPINVIPGLNKEIVMNSIYSYIRNTLNLKITSSDFTITGVRPDEEDKTYLNLKDTDFLLQIVQTVYLNNGTAFEYSIDKHIPEEFEYKGVETRNVI